MTTILKEIECNGNGLMKNQACSVRIVPSKEKGIRFFVKNAIEPFFAEVDNVVSTDHCVSIGDKKNRVMLVEHFMAACAICGLDSLDVYISNREMPIFDGSSKHWVELFKNAGIEKSKPTYYTVKEPVYYLNGKTHLVILPDDELNITYGVNYAHPDLRNKWVSFDKKKIDEIIEARTFGFLKDLKKIQFFGFAKGVTIENTVGLKDEGYTTVLRSDYEPIKHKILDLIGDLYLSGANPLNLKAQIIVKEAGHAVHVKTCKILKEKLIQL